MAAPQLLVVALPSTLAESAQLAGSRAVSGASAAPGGTMPAAAASAKLTWMGYHVVPPGPVAVAVGLVAGAPSTPPVRRATKMPPIPKQRSKKPAAKALTLKRTMKKGSLTAINAAAKVEDEALIKAWNSTTLDAVTGTDKKGKQYWQRIQDKYCYFMPRLAHRPPRTYRSLQG
jgi:hypothetical protein